MKCKKCGTDTWVGVETSLCDNCKDSNKKEAQQAQTIAECRNWLENQLRKVQSRGDYSAWPSEDSANIIFQLLEIVDSQAQKIAEQAKRIEILEKCYYAAMNRFAFDSEENRGAWYEAQNNKRDSEGFTVET